VTDSCNPVLPNVAHSTASHPEISFAPEFCSWSADPSPARSPEGHHPSAPSVAHEEEHRLPSLGEQLEALLVIVVQRDAAAGLALRVLSSLHAAKPTTESNPFNDNELGKRE